MVNYPTILGLPQEDIDRQLYVGVLGLESRVKALENKPKPTPTQTGTVTVTALSDTGGGADPVSSGDVMLATAPIDWADPDYSTVVALDNQFDETGTVTLTTLAELSPNIPFGTYYLCAMCSEDNTYYSGTLTVDGDEEVTITLTPIEEGD